MFEITSAQFETIDEPQPTEESGGCGFIPSEMLLSLLGGTAEARRTTAIQVRIVIPRLGIFKGELCRKRGIERIQLPPSMKKVPASLSNTADERAWRLAAPPLGSLAGLSGTFSEGFMPVSGGE